MMKRSTFLFVICMAYFSLGQFIGNVLFVLRTWYVYPELFSAARKDATTSMWSFLPSSKDDSGGRSATYLRSSPPPPPPPSIGSVDKHRVLQVCTRCLCLIFVAIIISRSVLIPTCYLTSFIRV